MEDNITVRNLVKKTVQDADMVLVGIGEEFGIPSGKMEESAEYAVFMEQTNGAGQFQWMVPFLGEIHKENGRSDQVMAAYQVLGEMIRDKNYFVVSTRTDDFIYDAGLREDRIVTPCGGYRFWQCAQGCGQKVYGREERLVREIRSCLDGNGNFAEVKQPLCPVCAGPMVPNNIMAPDYVEAGYLEAWGGYRKWLQGTVNRKLCVLELGVGMKYPGIIRWPFEKMVFFNEKSVFFRVHSKLCHLTEEIKDRGYKIKEKPVDFLTNGFV